MSVRNSKIEKTDNDFICETEFSENNQTFKLLHNTKTGEYKKELVN